MTYSDILKEMERHGMNEFCIERYEVEVIAPNKYLIHIIFDSEKKKMHLTARATDIVESHTFETISAFGGINRNGRIRRSGMSHFCGIPFTNSYIFPDIYFKYSEKYPLKVSMDTLWDTGQRGSASGSLALVSLPLQARKASVTPCSCRRVSTLSL